MHRKRWLDGLEQEIRDHLDAEIAEQIANGQAPEEARRRALLKFGNVTRVIEDTRHVWRVAWLDRLGQDLRHACRALAHSPAVSIAVVLILTIGIGFSTAAFGLVNAVLLRPPTYPSPERVVWIAPHDARFDRETLVSRPIFDAWRTHAASFDGIAAFARDDRAVDTGGTATQERVMATTEDFWRLAGARMAVGRAFGSTDLDAAVVSYPFFVERLNGDPSTVGRTLLVAGRPMTIVGVLEAGTRFPFPQLVDPGEPAAYVAMRTFDARSTPASVVARLAPGITIDQARLEMAAIERRRVQGASAGAPAPPEAGWRSVRVAFAHERLVRDARPVVLLLFAAAGVVLLVAATNVAGLLVARAVRRQREVAIRAALGAGRLRIMQHMVVENLLLGLTSGCGGLLFAHWALPLIARLGPPGTPGLDNVRINWEVLAFAAIVSVLVSVLCALGPTFASGAGALHDRLKEEGPAIEGGARLMRTRRLLVGGQVALALVLLTGAGLLVKSSWRMNVQPEGFAPAQVLLMRVSLSGAHYAERHAQERYLHDVLDRLAGAPGVEAVGVDCGSLHSSAVIVGVGDGTSSPEGFASYRAVSPDYLAALGAPLLRGRRPSARDNERAVMVNEQFARTLGIDQVIGRQIAGPLGGTIVGVVADFKHARLDADAAPEVYVSYARALQMRNVRVAIRTTGDPAAFAAELRERIADIDRTQPVYALQTLEEALRDSIAPRRFSMLLLAAFAGTALLLALVGLHAVMAYAVAQRTREIGIRLAMGAPRSRVMRTLLYEALGMALAGVVVGLVAALGCARLLTGLLYEVAPTDPQTFLAVGLTMTAAAAAASLVAAVRAARVDPLSALRHS